MAVKNNLKNLKYRVTHGWIAKIRKNRRIGWWRCQKVIGMMRCIIKCIGIFIHIFHGNSERCYESIGIR
jgi:hypothetical protein